MKKRKKEDKNKLTNPSPPTQVFGEYSCKSLTPEQNEQVRKELNEEYKYARTLSDYGKSKDELKQLYDEMIANGENCTLENGYISGDIRLEGFWMTDADGVIHLVDNKNK